MADVDFPLGMTYVTVVGHLSSPTGKFKSGSVRVYAERKVSYVGTSWIMDLVSPPVRTVKGDFALKIPHSDQSGWIGDNGATVPDFRYKIVFDPVQSPPITLAWQSLPTSLAAVVNFASLADLGGWLYQTIIVNPGGGGGGAGNVSYTETPAGSGLFVASVS